MLRDGWLACWSSRDAHEGRVMKMRRGRRRKVHLDARNSQGNAGLQQWQKREQRERATKCAPAVVMQQKEAGEGVLRGGAQRRGWYSPRRLVGRVGAGEGGCMGGFGWEICMREK